MWPSGPQVWLFGDNCMLASPRPTHRPCGCACLATRGHMTSPARLLRLLRLLPRSPGLLPPTRARTGTSVSPSLRTARDPHHHCLACPSIPMPHVLPALPALPLWPLRLLLTTCTCTCTCYTCCCACVPSIHIHTHPPRVPNTPSPSLPHASD